jgi:hypothetical protein
VGLCIDDCPYPIVLSAAQQREAKVFSCGHTSKPEGVSRTSCTLVPLQLCVQFSLGYGGKNRRSYLDGVYPELSDDNGALHVLCADGRLRPRPGR